jgi:hypothetical protein
VLRAALSVALVAAVLVSQGAAGAASSARAPRPFATALFPGDALSARLTARQVAQTGATKIRLGVSWRSVAPGGAHAPESFDATNPADPAYRWAAVDGQIRRVVAAGAEPILSIVSAPRWATGPGADNFGDPGSFKPDADDYGRFALAAARRYSGTFQDLPRVRYWEAWNEPNLTFFLRPQLVDGTPFAPDWYRGMVNAFTRAVHSVHRDNVAVAGSLAPFFDEDVKDNDDWGPLAFMRSMLCISKDLKPTCNSRVSFDAWSMHPYTSGGPTHHAIKPDDVSLGDLPEMKAVLDAARRAGHVVSARTPQFWVTEFSWDSKPPDPGGVPVKLLQRWVPQALYEMWRAGVSLVTWFSMRDNSLGRSFQSGLYSASGRPKAYLRGFRFPLVAFPRGRGVYVWGRTPAGARARVIVEQLSAGSKWRRLGTVSANRYGVFAGTFRGPKTGWVRGRLVGGADATLPFSLTPVPDQFFNPFGTS